MTNRIFGMTSGKAVVAALLCCVSALVTGCTTSQFVSGTDTEPVAGVAFRGLVHGGQNPVTSATIQLWTVGSGSYGATAAKLGPALTTNSSGVFTYTGGSYTCPSGSTLTYITSTGGNPGLGTGANSNIVLAAATGACSTLASATININEVTTAATAYALGQYFTPAIGGPSSADSFGAPSTSQAQTGIANAFATVNNLVNISTGTAITSAALPANCTSASTYCITMTPEATKLNTIADILAACVNSAGGTSGDTSSCGQLFAEVKTTSGTAPTDTLQAAVYMSLNPTSTNSNTTFPTACTAPTSGSPTPNNLCALFNLIAAGGAPFTAGTQPTDWTLGIQYTDTTTGTPVLTAPQNIAIDGSGDVWVASDTSGANGALGELSPTGTPILGTTLPTATGGPITALNPRNIAIDLATPTPNVWVSTSSSSGYLFEYNSTGPTISSVKLGKSTYGLAIDGSNDVFVGEESSTDSSEATAPLGPYSMYEFAGGNIGSYIGFPTDGTTNVLRPEYLSFDASGNLWATDGGDQATTVVQISGITPCTPSGSPPTCAVTQSGSQNLYTTVTQGTPDAPDGVAEGVGGIWYANRSGNNLTFLSLTGTTVNSGTNYGSATTVSAPKFVAVDGAGNVWTAANNQTSPASVSEISSSGTVLSPNNTGPSPFNVIGFSHAGLTTGAGVAIDPSGNVWVADDLASGFTSGASVFELVGAAAPTVTPIALQVKNSAFGVKP